MTGDRPKSGEPLFAVVEGQPSDEEVAALVVVLAARRAQLATAVEPARPRSAWADPSRMVRRALRPGPGEWRAQSFPG